MSNVLAVLLLTSNVNLWYSLADILPLVKHLRPRLRPTSDYATAAGETSAQIRRKANMAQYPPRHLVTLLNVSGTTVRRWSELYHRHLSPSATTAPRRYTDKDVAVMTRIKHLSESGMRIAEIDALLDQVEPLPPTEPPTGPQDAPTTALQTFNALVDTQQQIAATLAGLADVNALVAQIAQLEARVTRLERAAHRHTGMVKGTPID